jgi:phenylalanyl-tRNA synthetase beta chain
MRAQHLAARLMVENCGARLVPGTIDVDADLYEPASLRLRSARIAGLLGMEIPDEATSSYLQRLGFGVAEVAEGFAVEVPADRYFDVTREVDLIEEVGRLHGFDQHLESTLPPRPPGAGGLEPHQRVLRRAEDLLRDAGLNEVVTWAFVAPGEAARLGLGEGAREGVAVHNPLSEEHSVMRTSLLGGLIDAAAYNLARAAGHVALFESGRVYLPEAPPEQGGVLAGQFAGHRPPPAREPHRIGVIACGPLGPESWRGEPAPADFYSGKGLLELLCGSVRSSIELSPAELPFLHPGRAAEVRIGGTAAGWLGELHPRLAAAGGLPATVAFELDAAALFAASAEGSEVYEDLTSYPAVLEDIAVVVDHGVAAVDVQAAVRVGGGELLRSARIFDLYEGDQVAAGKRSLALRLEFRAPDRTLTDAEVATRREAIVAELARLGGSLRA